MKRSRDYYSSTSSCTPQQSPQILGTPTMSRTPSSPRSMSPLHLPPSVVDPSLIDDNDMQIDAPLMPFSMLPLSFAEQSRTVMPVGDGTLLPMESPPSSPETRPPMSRPPSIYHTIFCNLARWKKEEDTNDDNNDNNNNVMILKRLDYEY